MFTNCALVGPPLTDEITFVLMGNLPFGAHRFTESSLLFPIDASFSTQKFFFYCSFSTKWLWSKRKTTHHSLSICFYSSPVDIEIPHNGCHLLTLTIVKCTVFRNKNEERQVCRLHSMVLNIFRINVSSFSLMTTCFFVLLWNQSNTGFLFSQLEVDRW